MTAIPPAPAISPAPALPAPPPFPAFPLTRNNETDFDHVLEHVTDLVSVAQRARITGTAGVRTEEDLLYIDKELLLDSVTAATMVMSKMKLKALKRWVEEQETLGMTIDITSFTIDVYRKIQHERAGYAMDGSKKHQLLTKILQAHLLCLLRCKCGINLCCCSLLSFYHLRDPFQVQRRRGVADGTSLVCMSVLTVSFPL